MECNCDLRMRLVGDGCEACNPEMAADIRDKNREDEMGNKLSDFDRWFKPCEKCGYDAGKVSEKSKPNCWRCGDRLQRDYSERALKKSVQA